MEEVIKVRWGYFRNWTTRARATRYFRNKYLYSTGISKLKYKLPCIARQESRRRRRSWRWSCRFSLFDKTGITCLWSKISELYQTNQVPMQDKRLDPPGETQEILEVVLLWFWEMRLSLLPFKNSDHSHDFSWRTVWLIEKHPLFSLSLTTIKLPPLSQLLKAWRQARFAV